MKIWAKTAEYSEGKFLVVRRDGSRPHWPHFVLGARDKHAPAALRAYADNCKLDYKIDREYVASLYELAADFEKYNAEQGDGDPDSPPHRHDDPAVIAAMRGHDSIIAVRVDRGNVAKIAALREALTRFACSCVPGVCGAGNEHSPGVICPARQARKLVGPYEGMPTGALAKGGPR